MKLGFRILASATIAAATYSIVSCAAPQSFSYQNVSIALAAQCGDCAGIGELYNPAFPNPTPVTANAPTGSVLYMPAGGGQGGTTVFTATVTNAPGNVTWTIYPTPNLTTPNPPPTGTSQPVTESGSSVGVVNVASGTTAYYSAPSSAPVYSGAALTQAQAMGIPQGDILLVASVPSDPNNPSATVSVNQLIQEYGSQPSVYLTPATPTTPANITTPVAIVAHNGGTFQFFGGIVGTPPCSAVPAGSATCANGLPANTADNTSIWEVGPTPFSLSTAVPGGDATYGTISATGLYTAPVAVPPVQPVVILVSHFLPTVNKYAYINVN